LQLESELPIDAFYTFLNFAHSDKQLLTIVACSCALSRTTQQALAFAFRGNTTLRHCIFRRCRYPAQEGLLPLIQAFNLHLQVSHLTLEQSDLSPAELSVILASLKQATRLSLVTLLASTRSEHVAGLHLFLQDPGSLPALRLEKHGLHPQDCAVLQTVASPCRLELA